MPHLKNNRFKAILTQILLLLGLIAFARQTPAKIDIEAVRNDIINSPNNNIPKRFLRELDKNLFLVIYSGQLCFVHVQYKDYLSESYMKTSEVAVYVMTNEKWVFQQVLPYYYNITLIDQGSLLFLSENQFCNPNGTCESFAELNRYKDSGFNKVISFQGYNKTLHYNYLHGMKEMGKIKKHVGDTIAHEYKISKIKMKSRHEISFILQTTTEILEDYSDSLRIKTNESQSEILRKF